jgi:subtilase family serine protease
LSFALTASVLGAAQNKNKADLATHPGSRPTAVHQGLNPDVYKPEGTIIKPASGTAAKGYAHTNYEIFVPKGQATPSIQQLQVLPNAHETPASLGCVYNVGPNYPGCNPHTGGLNHPTGGWGAIVLVDAYSNPNVTADLEFFSQSFGLPAARFHKVYANQSFGTFTAGDGGTLTASCLHTPPVNADWGLEEDLDIEWAHAMAPSAQIVLVEACSNSIEDLLYAEVVANIEAQKYGGGDISNSWGGAEDPAQLGDESGLPNSGWDNVFYRAYICNIVSQCTFPTGITYFASAGDSGWGAQFPSSVPWVVSAGGTTVQRDHTGNFLGESCWGNGFDEVGSGGGPSAVEIWTDTDIVDGPGPWTNFQYGLFGDFVPRDTPDFAFDADPGSGVYVYDSYSGGWFIVGGTSVSSPALAGIVNNANNRFGNAALTLPGFYTSEEDNYVYTQIDSWLYPTNWYQVTSGDNGACELGICPDPGYIYNECTGIGTPRGKLGK